MSTTSYQLVSGTALGIKMCNCHEKSKGSDASMSHHRMYNYSEANCLEKIVFDGPTLCLFFNGIIISKARMFIGFTIDYKPFERCYPTNVGMPKNI